MTPTLAHYLAVSGLLFAIGLAGVILRRNILVIFMCLELMLNAANLSRVCQTITGRCWYFLSSPWPRRRSPWVLPSL